MENNTKIQRLTKEILNYDIEPTYGFSIGTSLIIGGKCYMLKQRPFTNKATLSIPTTKQVDLTNSIYDFEDALDKKEFIFSSADDLIKKIDKWLNKINHTPSDNKGNIYLITDGKYTKIGATTYNVEKRLNELQTGNAKKLNLIGSYEVENKLSTERILHAKYEDKNILNEWFELSYLDIKEILSEKISIVRHSIFQNIQDDDISSIKHALYCNYKEFQDIRIKKVKRKKKKIQELSRILELNSILFQSEGV